MSNSPIAIIGAGWAGLAAAVELISSGQACTLYEAGRFAGGRARSLTLDGLRLDNGQHILLGACQQTLTMMRRVGAEPDKLLHRMPLCLSSSSGFRLQLPVWPAPWNMIYGLISASSIGWREKYLSVRMMQRLQATNWRAPEQTSVSEWLGILGSGEEMNKQLWKPLCLAAMNTPAKRASAQHFAYLLRDTLGSRARGATDLLLPAAPLEELLPLPAVDWLQRNGCNLRFGQRVRAISRHGNSFKIGAEYYPQVIIAVAPQHALSLLDSCQPTNELSVTLARLASLSYEPIATVYLQYPVTNRLPYPMHYLGGMPGQWLVERGSLVTDRPTCNERCNASLLAVVQSGAGKWQELDNEGLCSALHAQITALPGKGSLPKPSWSRVLREQRATYACTPRLQRPTSASGLPGLWLAGDYCWQDYPATLESAVNSGLAAAQKALEYLCRQ